MKQTLTLVVQPSVVKRALKYAVVVGSVLILINHSDAILKGEVSAGRALRMALTVFVPYVVSTLSSVGVMREKTSSSGKRRQADGREA
ncbi:MAG: nitrate/nitrite transporter NrtS [Chloroflexi bacterium]|nr:nitrate/nitrite transporter NrtS [Chloroflexota bacterium]